MYSFHKQTSDIKDINLEKMERVRVATCCIGVNEEKGFRQESSGLYVCIKNINGILTVNPDVKQEYIARFVLSSGNVEIPLRSKSFHKYLPIKESEITFYILD